MDHLTQKAIDNLKTQLKQTGVIKFAIKVTPKSHEQTISGIMADGTIKIKLRSAAEHNRANEELIGFLNQLFEVPRKNIVLKTGQKNRKKVITIKTKI